MFSIVGIVSSYYPDLDDFLKNINSYLPWIDKLIIWENTPRKDSNIHTIVEQLNSDKVEVRTSGKNEYLAGPLNECISSVKDQGFSHVLTMDQDSSFAPGNFEHYRALVENYPSKNVAAFGPNSQYRTQQNVEIGEVENIFLSGAIYPMENLIRLNGFDEELAIDCIDTDYCYRASENNYKIMLMYGVLLNHQIGYRYKHWSGLIIAPYSAQRTYYFLRNTFWMWKKYPKYFDRPYKMSFIRYKLVYRSLKIFLEKDSIRKLRAISCALWHFKTKRLGRFDKFSK